MKRPKNDAAPLAGGAGVNDANLWTPDRTLAPRARRNAPETSHDAARAARLAATATRDRVLAALESAGRDGATDREIEATTGLRSSTVSPRRGELVKLGLVTDSGRRRRTESGCWAIVWIVAKGVDAGGGRR